MEKLHTEVATSENATIFATDGTYKIVQLINEQMKTTCLKKIYPTTDGTTSSGFNNSLFGDKDHGGKFLIELRDLHVSSPMVFSHFVSFDTNKLEIYDPMCIKGSIHTQRNIDGNCLFLETLHLTHSVKVFNIWKLFDKPKRTFDSIVLTEKPKKKKRSGKSRKKADFYGK